MVEIIIEADGSIKFPDGCSLTSKECSLLDAISRDLRAYGCDTERNPTVKLSFEERPFVPAVDPNDSGEMKL